MILHKHLKQYSSLGQAIFDRLGNSGRSIRIPCSHAKKIRIRNLRFRQIHFWERFRKAPFWGPSDFKKLQIGADTCDRFYVSGVEKLRLRKDPGTCARSLRHPEVIQLFQNYAKIFYFRQAFRQKKNRLKIACQVSRLGFSPIGMPNRQRLPSYMVWVDGGKVADRRDRTRNLSLRKRCTNPLHHGTPHLGRGWFRRHRILWRHFCRSLCRKFL